MNLLVKLFFLFQDECNMSNTTDISNKLIKKGKQPLIEQEQYEREHLSLFWG